MIHGQSIDDIGAPTMLTPAEMMHLIIVPCRAHQLDAFSKTFSGLFQEASRGLFQGMLMLFNIFGSLLETFYMPLTCLFEASKKVFKHFSNAS